MTPENVRLVLGYATCKTCSREQRRARRGGTAIGFQTPGGARSAGQRVRHALRRERGEPTATPAMQAAVARRAKPVRRWCKSGRHPWVWAFIYTDAQGRKSCARCRTLAYRAAYLRRRARQGRLDIEAERQRLWQARIDAHPDKGGTPRAFRAAHRAWQRFIKTHPKKDTQRAA